MNKEIINNMHRKAEFHKRAAWAHKRLADGSTQFKKELLDLAKEHSDSSRWYRKKIREFIKLID